MGSLVFARLLDTTGVNGRKNSKSTALINILHPNSPRRKLPTPLHFKIFLTAMRFGPSRWSGVYRFKMLVFVVKIQRNIKSLANHHHAHTMQDADFVASLNGFAESASVGFENVDLIFRLRIVLSFLHIDAEDAFSEIVRHFQNISMNSTSTKVSVVKICHASVVFLIKSCENRRQLLLYITTAMIWKNGTMSTGKPLAALCKRITFHKFKIIPIFGSNSCLLLIL